MHSKLEHFISGLKHRLNSYPYLKNKYFQLTELLFNGRQSLPAYAQWLTGHINERMKQSLPHEKNIRISILTTVYEKTDAQFLRETAESLIEQSLPFYEWLILSHGSIPASVKDLLAELGEETRIKLHSLPENLGIMGGMQYCLEKAKGDYIIPMDADDLLTIDALQVVASFIEKYPDNYFYYSDEDILVNGKPSTPYWRPDWDPVLNLASSYIWHLCVFHRETARQLGIYTDQGANWCHDWDTVFRFHNAGHKPIHIPEILYHWRSHANSSTHNSAPNPGSLESTRYSLESQISRQPVPDNYEVEDFPIFRGASEWHIKRRHSNGLPMDIIIMAQSCELAQNTLQNILQNDYSFHTIIICTKTSDEAITNSNTENSAFHAIKESYKSRISGNLLCVTNHGLSGLSEAVSKTTSDHVIFCSDRIETRDTEWPWEALKLIEFQPDIMMIGGRIINDKGNIIDSFKLINHDSMPICPDKEKKHNDPGYFAMSLKPHKVHAVPLDFFIANRLFLLSTLSSLTDTVTFSALPLWLGASALKQKGIVAFSPLINAFINDPLVYDSSIHWNEKERKTFMEMYGSMISNDLLSSGRFIHYQSVFQ